MNNHAPGPVVIFIEVPSAGSNEPVRSVKPRYAQQKTCDPWRPQRSIPSKADASKRLLENFMRQDQIIRDHFKPQPR